MNKFDEIQKLIAESKNFVEFADFGDGKSERKSGITFGIFSTRFLQMVV